MCLSCDQSYFRFSILTEVLTISADSQIKFEFVLLARKITHYFFRMLNFEKLLEEIGEFGNYQKYAIILLQARFEFPGFIGRSIRGG